MTDALIHLRVPAATKARWVRQSRSEGKRLTDWITEKVEKAMHKYIIQHLESGDFDYSDCGSLEGAWEQEKTEWWVKDHPAGEDSAKAEFLASLHEYTQAEVDAAHGSGYGWPKKLGLVDDK